jgi:pSer/pThr/pTyr-binding forkhead associated (FHA) protein
MPVLQLDNQHFPLSAGANRIGAGAGADITVPGYSAIEVEAVIDGGASPTIRRAEDAAHVRVNGVLRGAEPTPLMHGDKIEVAGLELRYAEDSKGGATQFVSASEIAAITGSKRTGAARATAASGGRLVSLVDGKEYSVPASGLVLGRDAACDVVVAQSEVSRRHAEIVPGDDGYTIRDTSANGLYVNGERVQGSHKLARADVVRMGSEEFRFYADVLPAAPRMAEPLPVAAAAPVQPVPSSDLVEMELLPMLPIEPQAPAAIQPPAPMPIPSPSAPPAMPVVKDSRPVLAMLESTNEGPGKGTQYELRSSLGHVGRGAHNDVRLSDESVSETHAKLQKREDGWYVVDMDSTNGTYVGGSRVSGERRLEGSPDVRFGGLKFRFTALGAGSAADVEAKGTRAIAAMPRASTTAAPSVEREAPPAATQQSAPPARSGVPAWTWIVAALVVGAAVAFFLLKGRS